VQRAVISTADGKDLRAYEGLAYATLNIIVILPSMPGAEDVLPHLVDLIATQPVRWPQVCRAFCPPPGQGSLVLDFGPSSDIAGLTQLNCVRLVIVITASHGSCLT